MASYRREAVQLLVVGRSIEAVHLLQDFTGEYIKIFKHSGINSMEQYELKPVMATLTVLAAAMVQTGLPLP
jgi:hypothetical protein